MSAFKTHVSTTESYIYGMFGWMGLVYIYMLTYLLAAMYTMHCVTSYKDIHIPRPLTIL